MIIVILGVADVGDSKISAWIQKLSRTSVVTVAVLDEAHRRSDASIAGVGKQAQLLANKSATLQKAAHQDPPQPDHNPLRNGSSLPEAEFPAEQRNAAPKNRTAGGTNGVDVKSLTGRQAEVAKLISCGLSNKQIGRELGMSDNTVRVHLKKIFRRLKVTNRTQAAMSVRSVSGQSPRPDV